jgi:hypothetical protein
MLVITCGTTDMPLVPVAFTTDGVNNFLEGALRTNTQDFLGKMEGFAIQGVKGMNVACKFIDIFLLIFFIGSAKNHKQYVSAAHANVHDLMGERLSKSLQMYKLVDC